jgi:hypothetical protein
MICRPFQIFSVCALAAVAAVMFCTDRSYAGGLAAAGVEVDADGILRTKLVSDPGATLTQQRKRAARAAVEADMMRSSKLRKISLNRLEAALAKRLEAGEVATKEMQYLVGLTQITHVFYYPETKDIVIAGPAEAFYEDIVGRIRGLESDAPAIRLEDLVAALRAYSPIGDRASVIGCSIDPTQEGLQNMQQYLQAVGGNIRPGDDVEIVRNLKENLGLQTVTIKGISAKTHFAQVMVEADYRMKLIGIGLVEPMAKIPSYVSKANPRDVSRNALQRWYFQPNYDCLSVSDDDLAMELVNSNMNLIGEDERVGADGVRARTGRADRASQAFCSAFTKQYGNLAAHDPVYAELKNLCDLAIVAAYIQHQDYYKMAGWEMDVLGDEDRFAIEVHQEPKQVETAVNAIWKGNLLMTPIGGGVNIQARQALTGENMKYETQGKADELRKAISIKDIPADQWWWD